jgi:hypothetical protein
MIHDYKQRSVEAQQNPFVEKGKSTMSETNAAVGIYATHSQAEAAVKELQRCGVDMKKLSIVGKDYHTEE